VAISLDFILNLSLLLRRFGLPFGGVFLGGDAFGLDLGGGALPFFGGGGGGALPFFGGGGGGALPFFGGGGGALPFFGGGGGDSFVFFKRAANS
jgi:hypothetical protein